MINTIKNQPNPPSNDQLRIDILSAPSVRKLHGQSDEAIAELTPDAARALVAACLEARIEEIRR